MKIKSLIKAALSQDMNLFKYTTKKNSNKITKVLFPFFLFIIVCVSIGSYAVLMSKTLHPLKLTYVMLSMFIALVTILTFTSGVYKSQGILFEARDNDLLFSLPISKSKILFIRIFKLLLFQYIYNSMFLLPTFIVYIYYESPGISFYIISILMSLLIPIIPTIISSTIGYLVKLFSSKSKSKKMVQTILSSIVFLGIFFLSLKLDTFIDSIAKNASSINDILIKVYYPIGVYVNLINNFNIIDLIKLLLINIIPFIIFIYLGSRYYFKIISNSKSSTLKNKTKENKFRMRSPIYSLTKKELKRYFSSPVYMFNTSFGLLLVFAMTILLCIKGKSAFDLILSEYNINRDISLSLLYYGLIYFSTCMTSITSSSISLEGKTINITKSLPISEKDIFKSKIIYPFIIEMPFILISEFIFFIVFKPNIFYIISILLIGVISVLLSAIIGIIVNLKYPKMNASNDTEVVKQSMSSMLSVFIGVGIFIITIFGFVYFNKYLGINILIILNIIILLISSIILYLVLIKRCVKDYRKINV